MKKNATIIMIEEKKRNFVVQFGNNNKKSHIHYTSLHEKINYLHNGSHDGSRSFGS